MLRRCIYNALFLTMLLSMHTACKVRYSKGLPAERLDSLRAAYKEDALRMAMRGLVQNKSYSIEIPEDSVEKYLRQLIIIHRYVDEKVAQDSLDVLLDLHTFPNPSLTNIVIMADRNSDFVKNLVANRETGNDSLNRLIEQFKLQALPLSASEKSSIIRLSSDIPVNTYALAREFMDIPGVQASDPELAFGGGMDILVQKRDNSYFYRFMKGAGDCQSGCIHKKYWIFEVDKRNKVHYLGSTGSLPAGVE